MGLARPAHLRAPATAHEALTRPGLVDQAEDRPTVVGDRHQRAPRGRAREIAARPVDRVDNPGQAGAPRDVLHLLAEDAVLGPALGQHPPHRGLGRAVGFGDGVEIGALAFDAEIDAPKARHRLAARGVGKRLGHPPEAFEIMVGQVRAPDRPGFFRSGPGCAVAR